MQAMLWYRALMPVSVLIAYIPTFCMAFSVSWSGRIPPSFHNGQLMDSVLPVRSMEDTKVLRYQAYASIKAFAAA
ncbi:hypothetical protein D1872_191930 [compost metagenome]